MNEKRKTRDERKLVATVVAVANVPSIIKMTIKTTGTVTLRMFINCPSQKVPSPCRACGKT